MFIFLAFGAHRAGKFYKKNNIFEAKRVQMYIFLTFGAQRAQRALDDLDHPLPQKMEISFFICFCFFFARGGLDHLELSGLSGPQMLEL